ncbi:hypothetical protein ACH4M4_31565 [Streptomyces sp. NPDC017254]
MAELVRTEIGPVDILVNNAGLVGPSASFFTGQSVHVDGDWMLH